MEDIFSGVWDFFAGVVEWSPVEVVETVAGFIPEGGSSESRPANRRNEPPADDSVDW